MAKKSTDKPEPAARAERWLDAPEEHDYAAAADYLSLLAPPKAVEALVAGLRTAPVSEHKAKDLLRASDVPLLPPDDPAVARDLDKVRRGQRISPILIIRGDLVHGVRLTIADGYHRVCASYHIDENAEIPCQMVSLP